jgi:hypothetical protein
MYITRSMSWYSPHISSLYRNLQTSLLVQIFSELFFSQRPDHLCSTLRKSPSFTPMQNNADLYRLISNKVSLH